MVAGARAMSGRDFRQTFAEGAQSRPPLLVWRAGRGPLQSRVCVVAGSLGSDGKNSGDAVVVRVGSGSVLGVGK
jgi:hypothetical protein